MLTTWCDELHKSTWKIVVEYNMRMGLRDIFLDSEDRVLIGYRRPTEYDTNRCANSSVMKHHIISKIAKITSSYSSTMRTDIYPSIRWISQPQNLPRL
jgi:hypothetical protein